VDRLAAAIQSEALKRGAGDQDEPLPPPRETRRVRFSDIATVRRIRSLPEWEELLGKLDARVRDLLDQYDVELE
jgi:hypothetical protein